MATKRITRIRPRQVKYLVIVRGKGTPNERREKTNIRLYPVRKDGETHWVTIPKD